MSYCVVSCRVVLFPCSPLLYQQCFPFASCLLIGDRSADGSRMRSTQNTKRFDTIRFDTTRQKNAPSLKHPLSSSSSSYRVPTNTTIGAKLLLGAALFGVGWGIGGVCPGPGVYLAATGHTSVLFVWWPCFWLGSFLG